jgi:hypothetical protein
MVILRAFLALFAGFASMAVIVGVVTVVLMKRVPEWVGAKGSPRAGYVCVNLGYSFIAATVGGYVTAWMAQSNPLIHTLALALIVLLLSALSALQQRGMQPIWYQLTLLAITPLGVFTGGLLRLRQMGIDFHL